METSKIKIKIGEHEFEAEGPAEVVQTQFEAFKELIASQARQILPPLPEHKQRDLESEQPKTFLEKIFKVEGRVVSLTAIPPTNDDSSLLIMLGQKQFRSNETPTGQEVGDGLDHSGIR